MLWVRDEHSVCHGHSPKGIALCRAASRLARRRLHDNTSQSARSRTTGTAPTIPRMMPNVGRFGFRTDPDSEAGTEEEDAVHEAFDGLTGVDPVAPDIADAGITEDTRVTTVVAPEMTSVETTVVLESTEETSWSEVARAVGDEPGAAEEIGAGEVGTRVGGGVDAGSAVVEGGDVVGCESVGVEVGAGVGLGLEEDAVVVEDVVEVVAAFVAGTR